MLDDLRARFKLKLEEPTSSTDETPVTRTYEVLLASDADRIDALSTSLAPHLASPAKGTARPPSLALPKTASGTARVSDATSGFYVDVQPAGLAAALAEVADGYVVYSSARSSKEHLLRRITSDGVEDFENFESAPASPGVSYDLGLSPKVAGLRLVGNSLEILDSTGTPRLRVPSPYLVDSAGARTDATLAVQGCNVDTSPAAPWDRAVTTPGALHCTLKVSWDGSRVTYPALLDPSWTTTGSMPNTQAEHTGILLATGKTLVIGPYQGHGCYLYDPPTGTWSTTGSLAKSRSNAMAVRLQDGKVLLAGGTSSGGTQNTAELYNPATGTWASTGAMVSKIESGTADVLANGKVLLAGGFRYVSSSNRNYTAEAELYNPATGTWSLTGSMASAHGWHASGLLPSGKVLVVAGASSWPSQTPNLTATTYDATTATWSSAGSLPVGRYRHAATVLPYGGKVLASGGLNPATSARLNSTALYDPATNAWITGPVMSIERVYHGAILLPNSKVLLAGGETNTGRTSTADLYDLFTNTITATTSMSIPRSNFSVTVAGDPATTWPVLVAGGYTPPNNSTTATAETFNAKSTTPSTDTAGESASMPPVIVNWTGFVTPTGTVSAATLLSLTAFNTTASTQLVHMDLVASGLDGRAVTLAAITNLSLAPGANQSFTVQVSQFPVQSIGSDSQVTLVARPYDLTGGDSGQNTSSTNLFYEFAAGYGTATLHGPAGRDLDRVQPSQSMTQAALFASMQPMLTALDTRQGRVWNAATGGFDDVTTLPPQGTPDGTYGLSYVVYGQWARDIATLKPTFFDTYTPPPGAPTRTICARWKARFDDGTSTDDYLHTTNGIAYVGARYASAFIYANGGGGLAWNGQLDANGCVSVPLGYGSFDLVWMTEARVGSSTLQVSLGPKGAHDPGDGSAYSYPNEAPVSIVSLNFPPQSSPPITIDTGIDDFTTRVAAVLATALRMPDTGFLPGEYYQAYANTNCGNNVGSCGGAQLFVGYVKNANTSLYYHQSLVKFVTAHEFGHVVFLKLFGGGYPSTLYDPSNPQSLTPSNFALNFMCRCDHVSSSNRLHCMQSRETQGFAMNEGIAHFYASKVFNDAVGPDCTFVNYKEMLTANGIKLGYPVSCKVPANQMDTWCPVGDPQLGVEEDWMTALYNIHTDATYAFSMAQLASIWRWACTGSASGACASQAIRFNKPPLGFTFTANQAPVVVTAGNTHLVDAACKVLNGVNGGGACLNQLDSRYLQFRDIGIQHGIDY